MLDKQSAKKFIKENCGEGWLTLVDIIYDNQPMEITINEVFQKYGGLEVRYEGEDENFQHLVENTRFISQHMCEICGQSGGYTIIDGWETILCNDHFLHSKAKKKYRRGG